MMKLRAIRNVAIPLAGLAFNKPERQKKDLSMKLIRVTSSWALAFLALAIFPLALGAQAQAPLAAPAAPPKPPPAMPAPANFHEDFEMGYLVFDDGVGVLHVRQS